MANIKSLFLKLYKENAAKFGKLKNDLKSSIHIDLSVLGSRPALMNKVSRLMFQDEKHKIKSVCSVPNKALPLAIIICSRNELPMVMKRKEAKDYGTKKMVEGSFSEGDKCLIIEDTVTSGSSILETAEVLRKEGLEVTDAIVLMDRMQGGMEMLKSQGIRLLPISFMFKLLDVLRAAGHIDDATDQRVREYIQDNGTYNRKRSRTRAAPQQRGRLARRKMNSHGSPAAKKQRVEQEPKLTYGNRAMLRGIHPVARRLLEIMEKKKTNLCFSADVTRSEELLELAESLGPEICILKTHCDILEDFTAKISDELRRLAEKHNFLIFEDRKFADIGNTVEHQYKGGLFRISSWSDIVNAHAVPGPGVLKGLSAVANPLGHGGLLIAQMSAQGCLATCEYTKAVVKMAEEHRDFVFGFICCSKITEKPKFIHLTPGVKLRTGVGGGSAYEKGKKGIIRTSCRINARKDKLGQQYKTPDEVIKNGSDVIIVGRGILKEDNRLEAARLYRRLGWEAYERKVGLVTNKIS